MTMDHPSLLTLLLVAFLQMAFAELAAAQGSTPLAEVIEIGIVVDKYAMSSWQKKLTVMTGAEVTDDQTKKALTDYMYSTFHDLNTVYKALLSSGIKLEARVTKIEFITDAEVVPEDPKDSGKVVEDTILNFFNTWLKKKSYVRGDHTMLLTGLDLHVKGGRSDTAGIASLGAMCSSTDSLSAMEAEPSSGALVTLAHELGHSLKADHDDGTSCGNEFIMYSAPTADTLQFSPCSIKVIKTFLESLRSGSGGSCLSVANTATSTPLVVSKPFGEMYTPDQVCQLNHGKASYLCREQYDNDYSGICGKMYCRQPGGNGLNCVSVKGSTGFVCGKGKKCSLGKCVASAGVPAAVTDTCPYGDTPGPIGTTKKTCSQTLATSGAECYQKTMRLMCCQSCPAHKTSIAGCEYGDKMLGCDKASHKPDMCYDGNDANCCAMCATIKTNVKGCEYGDRASWCGRASYKPDDCYNGNHEHCCATCKKIETNIAGCTYGDHWSDCTQADCTDNSSQCCKTCAKP